MRIFVNNSDSYISHAILNDLKSLPNPPEIVGTLTNDGLEAEVDVPRGLDVLISRKDAVAHRSAISGCDAVIFDLHSSDISEAEAAVSFLDHASLSHPVAFVLISSVMTWARTPVPREEIESETAAEPQEGEEPAKAVPTRPVVVEVNSWKSRVAPTSYQRWRSLESLVLKMRNPNIRPTVVCCGALYGLGEISGHFAEMLHASYFRDEAALAALVSHPGHFLPTVHVADAARAVTHVIGNPSTAGGNFVLAVDRGQNTQLEIAAAFAKFAGGFDLSKDSKPSGETSKVARHPWMWGEVDLRLTPSLPLTQPEFRGRAISQGLIGNIQTVVAEYTRARKLQPVRVAVVGPPCVGKSTIAAALATKLHLPLVTLGPIVKAAIDAGERVRAALASEAKKQEDLTDSDKFALSVVDQIKASSTPKVPGRLAPATIGKLVRQELLNNYLCASRGWILDGFPRSVAEAKALWTAIVVPAVDAAAQPAEAEAAAAAAAEAALLASEVARIGGQDEVVVLSLEAPTAKCQERSLSLAGTFAKGASHHYGKEDFTRRSNRHKAEMQQPVAGGGESSSLSGFFEEARRLATLEVGTKDVNEAVEMAVATLESSGVSVKFFENQGRVKDDPAEKERRAKEDEERRKEEQRRAEEKKKAEEAEAERRRREEEEEENIKKENEAKIHDIAVKEEELLEKQSRHLREYLEREVLPTLTAGILEICNQLPDDPIDFLAEYLFTHSQTLHATATPSSAAAINHIDRHQQPSE